MAELTDYKEKILKKKIEVAEALLLEVSDGVARQEIDIDYYSSLKLASANKKDLSEFVMKYDERIEQKKNGDTLLRAIEGKIKDWQSQLESAKN
jgi:hypothetical protein